MNKILSLTAILVIMVLAFVASRYNFANNINPTPDKSTETENLPIISTYPQTIYPGDPLFITINSSSSPVSISLDGKSLSTFQYGGKVHAIFPVTFEERDLEKEIAVTFVDGTADKISVDITPREKIEKPLGIPEKLGGNTPGASKTLVNNLADENFVLNNVKSAANILWNKDFRYPLGHVFVTDNYGYDRKTVGQTIVHKGTDFRAATGTEVMAMNDGVVEVADRFTVYGNTVVIDHGLGLHTLYMHLSDMKVKKGETVMRGDVIGRSGDTGYVLAPHLHISVKVNGVSIDPVTFLKFFE